MYCKHLYFVRGFSYVRVSNIIVTATSVLENAHISRTEEQMNCKRHYWNLHSRHKVILCVAEEAAARMEAMFTQYEREIAEIHGKILVQLTPARNSHL